nr:hypothetical protein [Mycoplasmopsis bovis]
MQIGTGLVSPISWLVIGGSLATGSIRKAIKDKDVLITSARRMITVPLVVLLVSYGVFAAFVYGKALTPEVVCWYRYINCASCCNPTSWRYFNILGSLMTINILYILHKYHH